MHDSDPMFRRVLHSGRHPRPEKRESNQEEGDLGGVFRDALRKKLGTDKPETETAPKAPARTKPAIAVSRKESEIDRAWDAHKRALGR
ncbi:MAG: hypothetical protein AAB573_02460 [Patescibacteria group bacterium]